MKKILVMLFLVTLGSSVYAQSSVTNQGYIRKRDDTSSFWHSEDGVLFLTYQNISSITYRAETLVKYPQNKNVTSYTIPDGVYIIAKGAFQGNKYLQKIRIPSSVFYIGDNAFDGCENLSSIEVYESSSTNVNNVFDDTDSDATEVGRYNIQGVKIQEGEDGQVQIILYSDGTSKKVVTK